MSTITNVINRNGSELAGDGSATKVTAGINVTVSGVGTAANPYVIGSPASVTQILTTGVPTATININGTSTTLYSAPPYMLSQTLTAGTAQTSFTLTGTPLGNCTMFRNGVRVKAALYTVSGSTVTYTPPSDGYGVMVAGDEITFDWLSATAS